MCQCALINQDFPACNQDIVFAVKSSTKGRYLGRIHKLMHDWGTKYCENRLTLLLDDTDVSQGAVLADRYPNIFPIVVANTSHFGDYKLKGSGNHSNAFVAQGLKLKALFEMYMHDKWLCYVDETHEQ